MPNTETEKKHAEEGLTTLILEVVTLLGVTNAARLFQSLSQYTEKNFFPKGELILYSYFENLIHASNKDKTANFIFFSNLSDTYAGIASFLSPRERQIVTQKALENKHNLINY
jgi:hypothetical protein